MRILLSISLCALLAGCGGDSDSAVTSGPPASTASTPASAAAPSGGAAAVTIADFMFGEPLTVDKGAKVTFTNEDTAPHNAVADAFKTTDLEKGDSDVVTFDTAGTFDYICTFHPYMKGSITVR